MQVREHKNNLTEILNLWGTEKGQQHPPNFHVWKTVCSTEMEVYICHNLRNWNRPFRNSHIITTFWFHSPIPASATITVRDNCTHKNTFIQMKRMFLTLWPSSKIPPPNFLHTANCSILLQEVLPILRYYFKILDINLVANSKLQFQYHHVSQVQSEPEPTTPSPCLLCFLLMNSQLRTSSRVKCRQYLLAQHWRQGNVWHW